MRSLCIISLPMHFIFHSHREWTIHFSFAWRALEVRQSHRIALLTFSIQMKLFSINIYIKLIMHFLFVRIQFICDCLTVEERLMWLDEEQQNILMFEVKDQLSFKCFEAIEWVAVWESEIDNQFNWIQLSRWTWNCNPL